MIRINPSLPHARQSLDDFHARVIVFDIDASPDLFLSLLEIHPDLLLLALDSKGDKLLMVSSKPSCTLTAGDLVQVIESYARAPESGDAEVTAHMLLRPRQKERDE